MQYLLNGKAAPPARASLEPTQDCWQKITGEAAAICSKLRTIAQVRKRSRKPVWVVSYRATSYELHYLPKPVAEWTLLPNDDSPVRTRLMLLVERALAMRGSGRR